MQYDRRTRALHQHVRTITGFENWLREGDELRDAAELLGGPPWERIASGVIGGIRRGASANSHIKELGALRALLHLDHADRPGSKEAAFFAAIHPDDPRADAARRCAEALDLGIAALRAAGTALTIQRGEAS